MDREEIVRVLAEALRRRADVALAVLFGSRARGDARQDSDIDLAIATSHPDLCDLAAELTQATGTEVHLVRLEDPGVPLLEELLRDGMTVFESTPGAGARWRSHALVDLEIDRPWFSRMSRAWLTKVAAGGLVHG